MYRRDGRAALRRRTRVGLIKRGEELRQRHARAPPRPLASSGSRSCTRGLPQPANRQVNEHPADPPKMMGLSPVVNRVCWESIISIPLKLNNTASMPSINIARCETISVDGDPSAILRGPASVASTAACSRPAISPGRPDRRGRATRSLLASAIQAVASTEGSCASSPPANRRRSLSLY